MALDIAALADDMDALAQATWQRVRHSPEWRISMREDGLTAENLFQLRHRHPDLHLRQFTSAEEPLNGADWEWWIGDDENGWVALRIQAKKWSAGNYEELTYKARRENRIQCRVLVEEATHQAAGRALHTFYCFYNGWDESTGWPAGVPWEVDCSQPANCATVPAVDVFGCALAPAHQVLEVLETHPEPTAATATLPKQRPWSWLFRSPFGSGVIPGSPHLALDGVEHRSP